MFGKVFNNNVFGLKHRILIRNFASETTSKKLAESAQFINVSSRSAFNAAIKLLPSRVLQPLCKISNLSSKVWYQSQVFYNVLKLVLKNHGYKLPVKADFKAAETQLLNFYNSFKVSQLSYKTLSNINIKSSAIVAGELASLFVIGEQVGRGKIIGYDA
ncbi:hypothetical protein BB561_006090 [Smittium simulii]|uniref:Uncharacterized protein n=1 Tax=Smittium simulii TaxID=133385 RepID=A0A2T9Y6P7_9FUNG|nr:hypothetical protein BB561_006090 [Smittium simulii]